MRRRATIRPFALVCLLAAMLAGGDRAAAQGNGGGGSGGGDDRGRLEQELQLTDEKLDIAAQIVRESDSLRARDLLEGAIGIQGRAWNQYRNGRSLVSARLTSEARQLGRRSVSTAREESALRNQARHQGDRAREALTRARDRVGADASSLAGRLLEEARRQIDRGIAQFQEQHYEAALRLAVSAQRLIRQAVGAGDGGAGSVAGARVLREIERTDRLVERALPVVRESEDESAQKILGNASGLQANAWDSYRADRLRVANATTREARGLVRRALSLVRGPVDGDAVRGALSATDELLARVERRIEESGSEAARLVLESAIRQQDQAKRLLADEKMRESLAKTRVARRLANRAASLAETGSHR